ncbi:GNAT family N-acetyltransferase [Hoeflea prorocentri]|uniref:GNAT family N-acetyltransferase n=1 Tax=Hoeflea prorocentri TaxID=1922333 RepID=A0A9X3UMI4_9HYPH|nr:GNAT family N-acetyltransferase [Hoeflea prorocentri]MCY6383334.1 GNAT family N-acetyltransferase [Hoeflea prorocentri]MDA5401134.1 GNAT family N-acetyltransferase [Hoeflea prorocentri]
MTYTLRDATFSDLENITEIYRDSVENGVATYELTPPNLEEMTRRFEALKEQGYPFIVADDGRGALFGYAYAGAYRTRPAYRWTVEDSIYLPQSARGRGIGKALLGLLVARCEALGFRQMVAIIGGPEPASVALHASLGFEHIGTMHATGYKFGRWLDTAIMQIALGTGQDTHPDPDAYPGTLFGP